MNFHLKTISLFFIFLLLSLPLMAQQSTIKGRVVEENSNKPVEFVSVFINNTSFGTTTNERGEFSIRVPAGSYEMIVSLVGYNPIVYQLEVKKENPPILFKLTPRENSLAEVGIAVKRDSSWYLNLEVFKDLFLGQSKIAEKCKLLNPEVLIIMFDPETGLLEVKAKDLLQIENPVLGYQIQYLLTDFKYYAREQYITYFGYPNFKEMPGNKLKLARFERNRLAAYNGSVMHFVRALREQRLEEEGFNLRKLIRKPNPDRPSEAEIDNARKIMQARTGIQHENKQDPVAIILSKSNLPKQLDYLDINPVPYSQYLKKAGEAITLAFKDYFQVVYTGEKEELAYVQSSRMFSSRQPTYQTSVMSLLKDQVLLDKTGSIIEPLDVLVEGYWGWEKVGDMLPLDYQVKSKEK